MSEGTWEFFTRIAEGCETMRRHSEEFVKAEFHRGDSAVYKARMLAYHLQHAEKYARQVAGVRPEIATDVSPEHPGSAVEVARESGVQR